MASLPEHTLLPSVFSNKVSLLWIRQASFEYLEKTLGKMAKHTFFKKIYLFYLSLASLGLRCCAQAFCSCGEQGLLFIAVRGLLIVVASHRGARALGTRASVGVARRLSGCGSRALERRLSSCGSRVLERRLSRCAARA